MEPLNQSNISLDSIGIITEDTSESAGIKCHLDQSIEKMPNPMTSANPLELMSKDNSLKRKNWKIPPLNTEAIQILDLKRPTQPRKGFSETTAQSLRSQDQAGSLLNFTEKQIIINTPRTINSSRRFSKSDSSHSPKYTINHEQSNRSPTIPAFKRSCSSPISLEQIDSVTAVGNRLITLSILLNELGEKQSIAVVKEQIFGIKKISQTTHKEREQYVTLILKCIKHGAEFGLAKFRSEQGTFSLIKMIENLQKQKWSSMVFSKSETCKTELTATIEAVKKAELALKIAKRSEISPEEASTIKFVEQLFPGKIEKNVPNSKKITLNDLSYIFPKLITPIDLFTRVLNIVKNEPSLTMVDCKKIGEFCKKCLHNQVATTYYPSLEIENLLKEIGKYLHPLQQFDLMQTYQITIIKILKAREEKNQIIQPLNMSEIMQIELWRDSIRKGHWHEDTVKSTAECLLNQTSFELSKVPLDELLSANLTKRECCPKFNQFVDIINFLTNMVAQDILLALNEPQGQKHTDSYGQNMITFYVKVIEECITLGDFASAFALYIGIGLHSITRLEKTWKGVPIKIKEQIHTLDILFDTDKNFQALKNKMDEYIGNSLVQPPFLLSKYITFIEETIPSERIEKTMNSEINDRLINQEQFHLLARTIIIPFQKMKNSVFSLARSNSILYRRLETMDVLSENDLYELSCKIEHPHK